LDLAVDEAARFVRFGTNTDEASRFVYVRFRRWETRRKLSAEGFITGWLSGGKANRGNARSA